MRRTIKRRAAADLVPLLGFGVFWAAGLAWLGSRWYPVEDQAFTELIVRRLTSDFPLSGAYSSLPFRHPGPALFVWLWWPYQLSGQRSSALLAGNLWFGGIAAAVILGTARRLGGRILALLFAVGIAVWSGANGLPLLLQPWNPYVGALPTIALILLTWAMVERRARALPIAVVLGSWMVQAHIQFGPIVAVLGLVAITVLVARSAIEEGRSGLRRLRWPAIWALGLGLLIWAPVAIDALVNRGDSNPAAIIDHYANGESAQTIDRFEVSGIVRSQLSLHPTWAGGPRPYRAYLLPVADPTPWVLAVAALAVAAAVRRRAWAELRGMSVGAVGLLAAFVALTRVSGPIGSWYLVAVEGASIAFIALTLGSLGRSAQVGLAGLRQRLDPDAIRPAWERRAASGGRVVLSVATIVVLIVAASRLGLREDEQASSAAARRMRPAVDEAIGAAPVFLEARSGKGGWVQSALVLALDRDGYDVHAATTLDGKFPADIAAPPPPDAVRLVVVTDPTPDAEWLPGVEVVAEERYPLVAGEEPIHVVIVSAPLGGDFITTFVP